MSIIVLDHPGLLAGAIAKFLLPGRDGELHGRPSSHRRDWFIDRQALGHQDHRLTQDFYATAMASALGGSSSSCMLDIPRSSSASGTASTWGTPLRR